MMAITGEAFVAAGRHVTDLLLRNLLNAFASTIWFTPMVIRMACFMLSLGWALLSGGTYWYLHRSSAGVEATPGLNAAILGASVYLITQFVLSFLGGILLSVLDAGGAERGGPGRGAAQRVGELAVGGSQLLLHSLHTCTCTPGATPHLLPAPLTPAQSSSAGPSTATARPCPTPRCTPCSRRCPSRGPWWSSQTAACRTARASSKRRLMGRTCTSRPASRTCERTPAFWRLHAWR